MFLVGTAMLVFGVGLYAMFMGSKAVNDKGPRFTDSNLFGLFYMKVRTSQSLFLHMWTDMPSFSSTLIRNPSFDLINNNFRKLQHGLI